MELLSQKKLSAKEDKLIRQMLSTCLRVNHSQEVTEAGIKLRKKYGLKIPDAIIAATAQTFNLPVLTADKEFSKAKDLDICLLEI
jgi:predicted nucleic acid-binding protein